jgi:hypothetical protein
LDAGPGAQEMHALRRALPILTFLPIAAWAAWALARRSGNSTISAVCSSLGVALGVPLIYAVAHFALIVRPDATMTLDVARSVAIASFAAPVFILIACIVYALLAGRVATPSADRRLISRTARWSVVAVAALTSIVAVLDWRAARSDVASWLVPQAVAKQPQSGEPLIEEAIRIQPYERYYRRQLVFELLGKAVADIPRLAEFPDRIPGVMRNLATAETAARTAALLFPRDPWVIGALANVLQVKALQSLRPFDPAGGQRAAHEANELFARAHRMFPSEPLLLRNWAQLMFDQGNRSDAYRLLDLMEKLIPEEPDSYAERIAMAGLTHDRATISVTLSRARAAVDAQGYQQLLTVANAQQK